MAMITVSVCADREEEFGSQIGEYKFIVVPRVGELVHLPSGGSMLVYKVNRIENTGIYLDPPRLASKQPRITIYCQLLGEL